MQSRWFDGVWLGWGVEKKGWSAAIEERVMSKKQVAFNLGEGAGIKPTFRGIRDVVKGLRSDAEILESVLTLADRESKYKDPPKERGGSRGPRDAVEIAMTTLGKSVMDAVWSYEHVYKNYENWLKHSENKEDKANRAGLKVWAEQMGEARKKLDDALDEMR